VANNNQIYKFSNAGGFKSLNRYYDMLAGNTTWNPWEPDGAYDALATVTVPSGGLASVTFAAIPNTYKHLQIRSFVKFSTVAYGNIRFNSDTTTSNYRNHALFGTGSGSGGANTAANAAYFPFDGNTQWGAGVLDLLDYANISKNKVTRELGGWDNNGSGAIYLASNLWMNTSAINSISITTSSGTFSEYSQFTLYGVK
jgi:hypothetical protein